MARVSPRVPAAIELLAAGAILTAPTWYVGAQDTTSLVSHPHAGVARPDGGISLPAPITLSGASSAPQMERGYYASPPNGPVYPVPARNGYIPS